MEREFDRDGSERVEFLGSMLTGVMTMTTTDLKRGFFKSPKKPVVLAALWMLLASFTANAWVERIEKHAAEDRLSFGTMVDTCIHAACSPSHFPFD
jgi:hypothetical protein